MAIKIVDSKKNKNSYTFEEFIKEAKTLSKLDHPNIMKVFIILFISFYNFYIFFFIKIKIIDTGIV